jgi:hypothetical protein
VCSHNLNRVDIVLIKDKDVQATVNGLFRESAYLNCEPEEYLASPGKVCQLLLQLPLCVLLVQNQIKNLLLEWRELVFENKSILDSCADGQDEETEVTMDELANGDLDDAVSTNGVPNPGSDG